MNTLQELIEQALASSGRYEDAYVFPTFLLYLPPETLALTKQPGTTLADLAMDCLQESGFRCDRVRKNIYGYPALFRELASLPPWTDWTKGALIESDTGTSPEPARTLTPLYLKVTEASIEDLMNRFREYCSAQHRQIEALGLTLPSELEEFELQEFREKLVLAQRIGPERFEQIYDSVFAFDDFAYGDIEVAPGTPDLFVWQPDTRIWFFAEAKGPGDTLRRTQTNWIRTHWDAIGGNFLLLVVGDDS
ncbi:VRR-NUC domain-containing protein [Candidatus Bipolaricaulota bacterium]|nr:VRR-NUC domain-containing protein [Candidatus Bipolaricaulota bacterium]